jgi:hypothetical protein
MKTLIFGLLDVSGINANFFVVFFKRCEIFSSLGEFTFLHTFADVPVYECTFGVKEVKLMVKAAPCGRDGGCVGQHAHATADLGQITAGDVGRRLVADTKLESSGAPVNELDCSLRLDDGNGRVHIFWYNISAIK